MKFKNNTVVKNISYSFLANIVSMGISAFMIMLLPKFMGVADYGIWQLYLFYISYLGVFHFGWLDGIYLRYGGYYLEQLDKRKFTSQFLAISIFETMLSIVGGCLTYYYVEDEILRIVLLFSCMVLVPSTLFTFCSFILQITNNIKQYAQLTLFQRISFLVLVLIYVLFDSSFYGLFWINVIITYTSMLYGVCLTKEIFVPRLENTNDILNESYENVSVGSKLLIANLAGMLMLGIVRFGISQEWDVITFGKISLTLSISNFFMVFINSLSVVFFPMLKRIDESRQKELYLKIRTVLMTGLFAGLLGYYPLYFVLSWWLPKYADSLVYMAMLFPICLYESKVVLLTNTYLKSLRQEVLMMRINFSTVLLSLVLTYVCAVVLHSLDLMVLSILVLFVFRSFVAELALAKLLKLKLIRYVVQELILTIVFILGNYFTSHVIIGISVYSVSLIAYLYSNRDILSNISDLRRE